ncbi:MULTISPECIES: PHP domain-containing protein [Lysobacter]|uniref:PHP domain-containing protein n=1 Tax=Lysobacter TaxID=68 RepID=UPI001F3A53FD|nr:MULTISPECIES: PHP domain-containing protein [Lysobacter]UJB19182.1 PHP domain-containing protein [Lysobacter capsici]UJQ27093.1 PHP domain-containing protein [Lysobacter gummosus]
MNYAELHCLSDFSFQRGAASASRLFERAKRVGYSTLAITDGCTMTGIVRAQEASKKHGLPLIVGNELNLECGTKLMVLVESKAGYTRLCELITHGRRVSEKGTYRLTRADVADGLPGCLVLWVSGKGAAAGDAHWMHHTFGDRAWLPVELHRQGDDDQRLNELTSLAHAGGLPMVATGGVHMDIRIHKQHQLSTKGLRHGSPIFPSA